MIRRAFAVALALASVAVLGSAAVAGAANRRVSISDYQWSDPSVQVNLGEHVTWYWVGPDTMHSVTGDSANTAGIDSDAGIGLPQHKVGDSFQVSFDQPGTYQFVCKLHSTVRGTITVTDTPGDPSTEPDPVPASRVDLKAPRITKITAPDAPLRGRGGRLRFSLDDRAKVDADYYQRLGHGRRKFAGWGKWKGHIGFNDIAFGGRGKHFDAKPGRYVAELRATDSSDNASEPRKVRFSIRRP